MYSLTDASSQRNTTTHQTIRAPDATGAPSEGWRWESNVAANVLMCLGELACVGGEESMPHVPELMQVIMSRLSDPSVLKRNAALHTLGQLCSSTGYVIAPLVEHPQLLPLLGRILKTETTQMVRREVVKVIGILGALDPYRRKVIVLFSCSLQHLTPS